jgi:hypothetical protein
MQQPLLHWLLAEQFAWQASSSLRQVAPLLTPVPDWQHWLVAEQPPPGATQQWFALAQTP